MKKRGKVHAPGLLQSLAGMMRARGQMLVRGDASWPLLLLRYEMRDARATEELRGGWAHVLAGLKGEQAERYKAIVPNLPGLIVVEFRRRNVCGCLGHHHPAGTESRLARKLGGEMKATVGEVDLAWEAIAEWRPYPLQALAWESGNARFHEIHFRAALLAVLLHELQHLAAPELTEREVREGSDAFYRETVEAFLDSARA